jgi:hypothetical protein
MWNTQNKVGQVSVNLFKTYVSAFQIAFIRVNLLLYAEMIETLKTEHEIHWLTSTLLFGYDGVSLHGSLHEKSSTQDFVIPLDISLSITSVQTTNYREKRMQK